MGNDAEQMVFEFMDTFETPRTTEFWAVLVKEELKEVKQAAANLLKELCDLDYVSQGYLNVGGRDHKEVISDNDYKSVARLYDAFGWDEIHEAFKRVHVSNMSKLGDNGEPIRREDGKILKGPNYQEPNLNDLVGL